tara:strand:- start:2003 stop:2398 length:396 start_codon:yes stop_codon:yes gene_type:complete
MKILFRFLLIISITYGCSSKPVLYPNSKLKNVGKTRGEQDVNSCLADADEYLESPKAKKILGSTGKGAVLGGAIGAVTGALTGNLGSGLARGAAIGGTAGGVGQAISPDELRRSFVNRCLADKGYQVLGWE